MGFHIDHKRIWRSQCSCLQNGIQEKSPSHAHSIFSITPGTQAAVLQSDIVDKNLSVRISSIENEFLRQIGLKQRMGSPCS